MYILYVEVFGLKLRWLAVATSFLLTTCAPDTPNTHLLHHISIWNGIFRNLDPDTLQVHIFICAQHFTLPFFHLKKNSLSIKAPVVSLGITQCPTFEGSRSTPCIALFLLFFCRSACNTWIPILGNAIREKRIGSALNRNGASASSSLLAPHGSWCLSKSPTSSWLTYNKRSTVFKTNIKNALKWPDFFVSCQKGLCKMPTITSASFEHEVCKLLTRPF